MTQHELIQLIRTIKADRLKQIRKDGDYQIRFISEIQKARLRCIEDSCELWQAQVDLVTHLHEILSNDRRRKAGTSRVRPLWNPLSSELWFDGRLIKKLIHPAPNQRKLLDWFQHHRFKKPIANPWLSITNEIAAIDTCINTVDGLNDDHRTPGLLRFGYECQGRKVNWQAVAES